MIPFFKTHSVNHTLWIKMSSPWGQHVAHLGPVGPRWAPWWPHELCHQGISRPIASYNFGIDCTSKWRQFSPVCWCYFISLWTKWTPFHRQHLLCYLSENFCIFYQVSLNFAPRGPNDKRSVLVQVMAWRRTGDKPLSGPTQIQFTDAYMRH